MLERAAPITASSTTPPSPAVTPLERPRLRVLHVITRFIVGGAQENTLATLIGQHRTPGMEVTLLCGPDPGPEGDLFAEAAAAGLNVHVMDEMVRPIRPLTDIKALAKTVAFIRRGRFDVVHTHSAKAGIVGRVAARLAGVPIIVHTVHGLSFGDHASKSQNAIYTLAERACAPMSHRIIDVSDEMCRRAVAAGVGRPEQHVTIYSGFDIRAFLGVRDQLSVAEAKARLGLAPDTLVVGKVARLFHQKGHEYVIEAARTVCAKEPRARFLFVGDGILRGEYEARIKAHGLDGKFVFTGLVRPDEVPPLMQAMDVLVHTSHREGLARVIPQAQAVGKPVVSFALDGSLDAIEDGVSGFLTRPHDAGEVATRLLELLADEPRRRSMGEAGRSWAAGNFPTEVMVSRINELYWQEAERRLPGRLPS